MKLFVLVDEWARDAVQGCRVVGVYTTIEEAREKMRKHEIEEFATEMDSSETAYNYIEHYDAGNYHDMHDRVFIEEVEC